MKSLILIKLGGSVITDKSRDFTTRPKNIERLAKEIQASQKAFRGKIIIGHGGGSFPHTPASKYQTKKGIIGDKSLMGMALVEDAARQLNAILIKIFLKKKLPVFPFSPASFLISDAESYSGSYLDPIKKALDIGILPVVYGDVITDKKQGCTIFSTERILSVIAKRLKDFYKIRMIYVTDVDGVYDEKEITIPVISKKNFNQLRTSISEAKGIDVTGGMLHKVEESIKLASKSGIETLIINGTKSGNLEKAIKSIKISGSTLIN